MVRTRATWLAYLLLGVYAYFQSAPGAIVPFLRAELGLGYTGAALHLTLFATGGLLAGATSPAVERRLGRTGATWTGAAGLSVAALVLVAGRSPAVTLASAFTMGWIGTLVLVAVQSALADEHGEARAVALSESNVLASAGALGVPAVVASAEAAGLGWRTAILAAVVAFAALAVVFRQVPLADTTPATRRHGAGARRGTPATGPLAPAAGGPVGADAGGGRLPRGVWPGVALVAAGAAAEWCIGFWAATFLQEEVGLPVTVAVGATTGFYAAMLTGRVVGSVLARRVGSVRLLGAALAVAAAGFPLFWLADDPVIAVAGLVVAGLGLGDVFPLSIALAMDAAPAAAARVSALGVQAGALSILALPLGLGALAGRVALRPAFALVPVLLALAAVAWWTARSARPATSVTRGGARPGSAGPGGPGRT